MDEIKFDFSKTIGTIKPMHAVNNGPIHKEDSQNRTNLKAYSEAGIPYARNHDASFCSSYGGEHIVDIGAIFPDFDADPYAEESYDFTLTDVYSKLIEKAGAKVFYRLGSKIEHSIKKYGTLPPKDYQKWAVICEHIIRHYTEGWANGLHMDIEYWEIWNEPDLDKDDAPNKRTWGGTTEEFIKLYIIAATHLKRKFPHLKVGGPALAHDLDWMERFLDTISKNGHVPLDFFSWHVYAYEPEFFCEKSLKIREMLNHHGYTETESILNEWNYVKSWGADFVKSIETIISLKGAAFVAAVMSACQDAPVDMLMYYDARPCVFNGMFDLYTLKPLKGYYPFKMFNRLYRAGEQVLCEKNVEHIYVTGAIAKDNKGYAMITYYSDEEDMPNKMLHIQLKGADYKKVCCFVLDESKNDEFVQTALLSDNSFEIEMAPNTVVLLEFV